MNRVLTIRVACLVKVNVDGGRPDDDELRTALESELCDYIEQAELDGTVPHATKDDDLDWTTEHVSATPFYGDGSDDDD